MADGFSYFDKNRSLPQDKLHGHDGFFFPFPEKKKRLSPLCPRVDDLTSLYSLAFSPLHFRGLSTPTVTEPGSIVCLSPLPFSTSSQLLGYFCRIICYVYIQVPSLRTIPRLFACPIPCARSEMPFSTEPPSPLLFFSSLTCPSTSRRMGSNCHPGPSK